MFSWFNFPILAPSTAADATVRAGGFQRGVPVGLSLAGKTLGVVGLGRLGSRMARYAAALDMKVIAWSSKPDRSQGPGLMANWALASHHSRGGIFHVCATWRKTRHSNLIAASVWTSDSS